MASVFSLLITSCDLQEGSSMMGGVDNKTERRVIDILRKTSPQQCKLLQVGCCHREY